MPKIRTFYFYIFLKYLCPFFGNFPTLGCTILQGLFYRGKLYLNLKKYTFSINANWRCAYENSYFCKCKLLGCTMRIYVFQCGLGSYRYCQKKPNMIYEDSKLLKTYQKQFLMCITYIPQKTKQWVLNKQSLSGSLSMAAITNLIMHDVTVM